jgi:hypothetical protein
MNRFVRSDRAGTAAVLAATGFAGIALFQIALALGAPWGHAAWGGAEAHLSTAQRIGSAVAAVIWTAAGLVVLGRAGFWRLGKSVRLYRWGTWFLVALLGLSAVPNFASQSHWENFVLGPLSVLLAILCMIVARSRPTEREGDRASLPARLNATAESRSGRRERSEPV